MSDCAMTELDTDNSRMSGRVICIKRQLFLLGEDSIEARSASGRLQPASFPSCQYSYIAPDVLTKKTTRSSGISSSMSDGATPQTETTSQLESMGSRNSTAQGSITSISSVPHVFLNLNVNVPAFFNAIALKRTISIWPMSTLEARRCPYTARYK